MIKVMIAEDIHMVRGALVALLQMESDIEVVADVGGGDEIMAAVRATRPDVAVIDVGLPRKDGLTAASELHEQVPQCRTLILTGVGRPGTLRRALAAKVGGFLLKDAPADRLATAIREVSVGRRVVDTDLALAAWDSVECPLTTREIEVLRLASDGSDVVDIAVRLCLSAGTVRNYLATAVTRLSARNRLDAIRIAKDSGWL